jgi:hypothetical protein
VIRRIITALAIISFLLCLGFITIWMISCFHEPQLTEQNFNRTLSIRSAHGQFKLIWSNWQPLAPNEKPPTEPRFFGTIDWPTVGIHGVWVPRIKDPTHYKGANAVLTFPCWLAVLMTALLPMVRLASKKRKTSRPNHCTVCDYDMRATPKRCPECGSIPSSLR